MKLQANADTSTVAYKAEFSEEELRLIAVALRNNYWNCIGSTEQEDICTDMVKKINLMLPSVSMDMLKEYELNYKPVGISLKELRE